MMKSIHISRNVVKCYKMVIRPTVTYAYETSVIRNIDEERKERWDRKMLRNIYGGLKEELMKTENSP